VQVDTDTVVLGIAVEEHAELQQRVGRVLNTRNHGAWREGGLFDIAVVVLRVLVEHQAAELVHGELITRPDLRNIEGIEAELCRVGVFGLHDLYLSGPFLLFTTLHGLPQLLLGVVRVLTRDADGFRLSELLLAVLGNEVVLDVDKFALLVDPLECVATIAVVVGPSLRCTVVTEEHDTGMNRFGGVAEQIECGIVVEQEVTGVACLGTDNIGSLDRVAAEEDREVEANDVVVAPETKKSVNYNSRIGFVWVTYSLV